MIYRGLYITGDLLFTSRKQLFFFYFEPPFKQHFFADINDRPSITFLQQMKLYFFQVYFVYPKRRKIDTSSSFRSVINKVVNSGGFFFSGIYFILCYGGKFTRVNVSVDILRVQVLHIFLINKIRIGYNLLS